MGIGSKRRTTAWAIALGLVLAGVIGCSRSEENGQTPASGSAAGKVKATATVNRPPKARLQVSPLIGLSGLTGIDLDASLSSDDVSLASEMLRRWDYDGDGRWDTGLTHASRTTYVYEESGRYRPRVLVVDASGLADSTVGPEVEIRPPCPAPDFALIDVNPNSPGFQRVVRLSEQRGHPVLAWFVAPSK